MLVETLSRYAGFGGLDAYNAVHFYSENQKRGKAKFTKTECVNAWNRDYQKIESEIIERMLKYLSEDQAFYLIVPPNRSRKKGNFYRPLN